MLTECAEKIMAMHLNSTTHSDPDKKKALFLNQMRLKIAYGQFDDAINSTINHNYETAVYHYRVSKTYAIKILEQLSKPDERENLVKKYKVHKADNLNRILNPETEKKEDKKDASTEGGPK